MIEVANNCVGWHTSAAKHGSAAVHTGLNFDEWALGPVDFFWCSRNDLPHYDSMF